MEKVVVRLWLDGAEWPAILQRAGAVSLALPFFFGLLLETSLLTSRFGTTKLEIDAKGLTIFKDKPVRIAWAQLRQILIEPVVAAKDFVRLRVFYANPKHRIWIMPPKEIVLDRIDQLPKVLEALRSHHHGSNGIAVRELEQPSPAAPVAAGMRALPVWLVITGMWCLVHGVPILAAGVIAPSQAGEREYAPAAETRRKQVGEFLLHRFSTLRDLQQAFVLAGAALSLAGGALLFSASLRFNSDSARSAAERARLLDELREARGKDLMRTASI